MSKSRSKRDRQRKKFEATLNKIRCSETVIKEGKAPKRRKKIIIKETLKVPSDLTMRFELDRKGDTSAIPLMGVCSLCRKRGKTVRHHLAPAWTGRNDPYNLIELCVKCHSDYHTIAEDVLWNIFSTEEERIDLKNLIIKLLKRKIGKNEEITNLEKR